MIRLLFIIIAFGFLVAPIAVAEEKQKKEDAKDFTDILADTALPEGSIRHKPADCDFEITFPGKPYTAQRCPKEDEINITKECYDLTGYTMVYDVTTTIEVTMTCVPSTQEQYKKYNENVIRMALEGMIKRADITQHEINTTEKEDMRLGSLLGSTTRGKQNSIYNAQLWVGQNSVMTIEAKLIGPEHAKADKAFSDILSSIKKQNKN